MRKLYKIIRTIERKIIQQSMYINVKIYMKWYLNYLRKCGMRILGKPNYISNDVHFDGTDYSVISIGEGCTISREVLFLTHDFSMHTVLKGLRNSLTEQDLIKLDKKDKENNLLVLRGISIGNFSFIGARVTLLPGTKIGNNCIIGSGSVVKGTISDNSVVIGNPAKTIAYTDAWLSLKSSSFE